LKRSRFSLGAIALLSAGALALAGCAATTEPEVGDSASIITTNGSEPLFPLVTTNATETGAGKILTLIFAGLVSYKADGSIVNEVAESIESEDGQTWNIVLEDGWKFTNGEPVTAASFANAWNYGALYDNAQGSSYFFENIEGFADVQNTMDDPTGALTEDGTPVQVGDPLSDGMSGLVVVDDMNLTVKLSQPSADWPLRLGYTAFMPLPDAAFENIEAFGENPIGNGPYMLAAEGAWVHDVGIELIANPDYDGVRTPANGGVSIVFYTDLGAAYADAQSGNLDVLDSIPSDAFGTYQTDFPDTFVNQPAAIFQAFNIPYYLEHFGVGKEGELRRQAISMAINRDEVTDVIFQGTRTPATDFTSPVIDGYSESLEGAELLQFNPEKAKELWAEADAIAPYADTFTIAYNADGGHAEWIDAIANSIKNTLGINAEGKSYPTFSDALKDRVGATLTGATRAGWQADYPSMANFLAPLYTTNGGSNYEGYASAEFDALIAEGDSASTVEAAILKYQEAQELLLQNMPSVPLWYSNVTGVYSPQVSNVVFGWDSVPLYSQITKK
jgi:oligopeptide transport system substrate-binding protein